MPIYFFDLGTSLLPDPKIELPDPKFIFFRKKIYCVERSVTFSNANASSSQLVGSLSVLGALVFQPAVVTSQYHYLLVPHVEVQHRRVQVKQK